MKATIYTAIGLAVAAAIAYMVYTAGQKKDFVPTGNFEADDERLYQQVRTELQAYEMQKNKDTLVWFDDLVTANYDTSFVGTHKSKTAAYVNTLKQINPTHDKKRWFDQLLTNLKNRYQ